MTTHEGAAYGDGRRDDVPTGPAERRLPFGIVAVVALRLIDAIGLILIGFDAAWLPVKGLPILGDAEATRIADLTMAALIIIGLVGLLARQGWGWVLTVVLVGIGLVSELVRYAAGAPDPLGLAILVASAFYLNQRSVRAVARGVLDDDR